MLSILKNTPIIRLGTCLILSAFHTDSALRLGLDHPLRSTYLRGLRELQGAVALPAGLWTSRGYGWAIDAIGSGNNDNDSTTTLV
jgi:hypothetical protein